MHTDLREHVKFSLLASPCAYFCMRCSMNANFTDQDAAHMHWWHTKTFSFPSLTQQVSGLHLVTNIHMLGPREGGGPPSLPLSPTLSSPSLTLSPSRLQGVTRSWQCYNKAWRPPIGSYFTKGGGGRGNCLANADMENLAFGATPSGL